MDIKKRVMSMVLSGSLVLSGSAIALAAEAPELIDESASDVLTIDLDWNDYFDISESSFGIDDSVSDEISILADTDNTNDIMGRAASPSAEASAPAKALQALIRVTSAAGEHQIAVGDSTTIKSSVEIKGLDADTTYQLTGKFKNQSGDPITAVEESKQTVTTDSEGTLKVDFEFTGINTVDCVGQNWYFFLEVASADGNPLLSTNPLKNEQTMAETAGFVTFVAADGNTSDDNTNPVPSSEASPSASASATTTATATPPVVAAPEGSASASATASATAIPTGSPSASASATASAVVAGTTTDKIDKGDAPKTDDESGWVWFSALISALFGGWLISKSRKKALND